MTSGKARHGWDSNFPVFRDTKPRVVRTALNALVKDASPEQIRAWDDSIPLLQEEVGELCLADPDAPKHTAILEYELPLEFRRPDVILLVRGAIVVLELKGKTTPSQADLDQAAAYARDLRCYHRACANRPVHVVLVPTRAHGYGGVRDGVHISGPNALDALVQQLQPKWEALPLSAEEFLSEDAYRPLPTLVMAARELFHSREVRSVWRASATTDPCVDEIARIVHEAARTKTRHLVLVTGVPGAGKTLVGLRVAHANYLDDLSVERAEGRPTTPAVFLSGNGPLVEVLQYELRAAGGNGRVFVRGVKEYVASYSGKRSRIPPEHVLIFDEAQRAWDADRVAEAHSHDGPARSEPEHFIEFSERIPEWCVVVGLVGTGQEIHHGEEAGLGQWHRAVEGSGDSAKWTVHAPPGLKDHFRSGKAEFAATPTLNLDTEIRFHLATDVHRFVAGLLEERVLPAECFSLAESLRSAGYRLYVTRSLEAARKYLRERFENDPAARFGLIASSKDKELVQHGVDNDFMTTKRLRVGPWFGDVQTSPYSCCQLATTTTEFQVQGLELDGALLAWGTDFIRENGRWTNKHARGYLRRAHVKDPFRLRLNAYRVLLTRARSSTVIFVPAVPVLDETHSHLLNCGVTALSS